MAEERVDLVVVGGGIAGASLATRMARAGRSVVVLEKQTEYADRVRGEIWALWGVAEALRVGVAEALFAGEAFGSDRFIIYHPALPPEMAEAGAVGLAGLVPGVERALNMTHPAACRVLAAAAVAAGAEIVRGVEEVEPELGPDPAVTFVDSDGRARRLSCRLVVGADGRGSGVRRRAGIQLQNAPAAHVISGMLVGGLDGWPDGDNAMGTTGDVNFFSFPQGPGRCRYYIAHDDKRRFAGGAGRFLEAMRGTCLPQAPLLEGAVEAGPCLTYGSEDTWTDRPYAPGVVLVGDAAGYNDPIIGQGLSLAMRDVRIVTDLLLENERWTPDLFAGYGAERVERMRRVRSTGDLMARVFAQFGDEADGTRLRAMGRMMEDEANTLWLGSLLVGPEAVPDFVFEDEYGDKLVAA